MNPKLYNLKLFAPRLPAEIERAEREKIARKKPHLSLVRREDTRPDPDIYRWHAVADLLERA